MIWLLIVVLITMVNYQTIINNNYDKVKINNQIWIVNGKDLQCHHQNMMISTININYWYSWTDYHNSY